MGEFVICPWSFVLGHLSLVICHLSFVICPGLMREMGEMGEMFVFVMTEVVSSAIYP
jgi:hypothetical protein